ncbi:hypothetical protein BGZ99_001218 [Dissophora globulifera]|uniref:Prokaryotic-type class I peptide chain release factors domain-containing protein n=1 Tax=Dissophora globulifera TaxID=979702 RepID=A0A9P6V0L1_9FUNG|nr:hypothetical protein BGZ99_001218 [Dissophora globulifera]
MLDSGLTAHDQLGSEVVEADVETEVKSETTLLPVGPGTHSAQPTNSTPLPPVTYKEIVLLETDFRERFIKGGGNGGQKINKTNSNVELKHHETGIVVQCQATRSLPQNRKLARKILIARLDEYYNGAMSKRGQKAEKIRQRKQRMARKSAKKYHGSNTEVELQDSDEYDVDDAFEDGIGEDDDTSQSGDNSKNEAKSGSKLVPKNAIQFTTLEEIMASDNKKASRRKAARKH